MGWVAKIKNFSKNRFASLVRTCLYLVTTFEVVTKYRQVRTSTDSTDKSLQGIFYRCQICKISNQSRFSRFNFCGCHPVVACLQWIGAAVQIA